MVVPTGDISHTFSVAQFIGRSGWASLPSGQGHEHVMRCWARPGIRQEHCGQLPAASCQLHKARMAWDRVRTGRARIHWKATTPTTQPTHDKTDICDNTTTQHDIRAKGRLQAPLGRRPASCPTTKISNGRQPTTTRHDGRDVETPKHIAAPSVCVCGCPIHPSCRRVHISPRRDGPLSPVMLPVPCASHSSPHYFPPRLL